MIKKEDLYACDKEDIKEKLKQTGLEVLVEGLMTIDNCTKIVWLFEKNAVDEILENNKELSEIDIKIIRKNLFFCYNTSKLKDMIEEANIECLFEGKHIVRKVPFTVYEKTDKLQDVRTEYTQQKEDYKYNQAKKLVEEFENRNK